MKIFLILAVSVALFGVVGCSSSSDDGAAAGGTEEAAVAENTHGHEHATYAGAAEVGCGMCTYQMEGVEGCVAAVKYDGKAYLLTGQEIDAHGLGLCTEPKQAEIEGEVHGTNFVATTVTLN